MKLKKIREKHQLMLVQNLKGPRSQNCGDKFLLIITNVMMRQFRRRKSINVIVLCTCTTIFYFALYLEISNRYCTKVCGENVHWKYHKLVSHQLINTVFFLEVCCDNLSIFLQRLQDWTNLVCKRERWKYGRNSANNFPGFRKLEKLLYKCNHFKIKVEYDFLFKFV